MKHRFQGTMVDCTTILLLATIPFISSHHTPSFDIHFNETTYFIAGTKVYWRTLIVCVYTVSLQLSSKIEKSCLKHFFFLKMSQWQADCVGSWKTYTVWMDSNKETSNGSNLSVSCTVLHGRTKVLLYGRQMLIQQSVEVFSWYGLLTSHMSCKKECLGRWCVTWKIFYIIIIIFVPSVVSIFCFLVVSSSILVTSACCQNYLSMACLCCMCSTLGDKAIGIYGINTLSTIEQ